MGNSTSSDGSLYHIDLLDRIYVKIYDKKGIASLYDPCSNHQLNVRLGKRLCEWAEGFPTKEDFKLQGMLNPKIAGPKFEIQYKCIEFFLRRFKEWKEEES